MRPLESPRGRVHSTRRHDTIRAWLGHVSLETTNRYAEVDLEMKAKALETCAVTGPDPALNRTPSWRADSELMSFLASL